MAVPEHVTMKDLTGSYQLNKTDSNPVDPILTLQGIGWFLRKGIGLSNMVIQLKQYVDDQAMTHLDATNVLSGGIKGTTELRTLDNQWREHSDYIFGTVRGRSKYIKLNDLKDDDVDQAYMKKGWAKELYEQEVVESFVENEEGGWTGWQVWGLVDEGGKKRYARHIIVRKGDKVERATLIYDWVP